MHAPTRDEYVEFVTTRLPALRRLAYGLCGDWHRADDLVQATLTKSYVKWTTVRASADIDSYVRAILVKSFLSERRTAWSRVHLFGAAPEAAAPEAGSVEDRTVLDTALDQLPRRQRAVVVLRYLCDMSVAEVAEALGCSSGTVKSQASDGLAALRRHLGTLAYPARGGSA
ncbi:MAG TPA: SigE family RNA polymerase sigma factor [Micromonosporaceae bacterium]|nr:SigE family RNA polymerase sigma factor [Micromonosporaceae bacterium]